MKYNPSEAPTVGPLNKLRMVSKMTFKGEVAEFAMTPGKKPQVPLLRRVLT
jgi:hypothetical protein